ncbi:hypothetical protein E4P41_02495 [Geodermatophilus sp. DF01-2]|uniref:hypothetical protein n=1 Tax=Geodermatophilus sp. DF01-2 TaxID=2559610 RepID=UPI0010739D0E|nr:hypothetical protein [Geodermatophilus sp. DF01_2]TFV64130.1 hypothetical protein E4P41_02495 [Geodermatophilus sp. DF01_2]
MTATGRRPGAWERDPFRRPRAFRRRPVPACCIDRPGGGRLAVRGGGPDRLGSQHDPLDEHLAGELLGELRAQPADVGAHLGQLAEVEAGEIAAQAGDLPLQLELVGQPELGLPLGGRPLEVRALDGGQPTAVRRGPVRTAAGRNQRGEDERPDRTHDRQPQDLRVVGEEDDDGGADREDETHGQTDRPQPRGTRS